MTKTRTFHLADYSRSFATRTRGQEIAISIAEFVAETKPESIEVAWGGVAAASPSFIDEFVGGIDEVIHSESCGIHIFFTGDEPAIVNLVDTILRRRESPIRFAVRH